MMRLFRWLDPRIKTEGLRYRHYVATTTLGLVSALVFVALVVAGVIYGGQAVINWHNRILAARAALHIKGGVKIPNQKVYIAPKTGGPTLPGSAGIYFKYFMGTTNQGGTLSCAAQGAAKTIAYQVTKKRASASNAEARYYAHHKVKISPRQLYDLNTGGASVITSVSDYNAIAATNGTVSTTVLNYGPNQRPSWISAWGVEPVPSFARYGHRIATHASFLWYYPGAGYGAVQRAKEAIYGHRPVAIGSDWYFNAEKSSWTTGKMGLPVAGDWVEYGHTTVLVRYNDSIRMPDGTTGAFLASNSFGKLYGRNAYGNIQRGHGGYVWLSYAYVGRYAAYGTVEDLGPARTGGGSRNPKDRPAVNPHAPVHAAPFDPGPPTGGGTYSPYVHGVVLHDTGYDITGLINYWVSYYHRNGVYEVSGPAIVATGLQESGLNQYAPRCCIPGDTSYSTFQFTLETACAYGICSNIEANLNNPLISTRLVAEYLDNIYHHHPAVPYPHAYVFFNAGLGVSDAFAWNPCCVAYTNLQVFFGNWDTALAYYMGGAPAPAPVVRHVAQIFHIKNWCRSYIAWKIKGCPSAYWHKQLGLVPRFWAFTKGLNRKAGGVAAHAVWHPKRRFMSQRFTHAVIFSWPTHRGWRPKVAFK